MRKDCWITPTMYLEEAEDEDGDVDEEESLFKRSRTVTIQMTYSAASFSLAFCLSLILSCSIVWPRKQGSPVSNISWRGKSFSDLLQGLLLLLPLVPPGLGK